MKGGQAQIQAIYLLDASSQTETTDDQFFCSNANGSLTVTVSMHALPPGKYAVVLANAAGAPLGGQLGLIVVWDPTGANPSWKLGGVSVRQGITEGHDLSLIHIYWSSVLRDPSRLWIATKQSRGRCASWRSFSRPWLQPSWRRLR